MKFQIGLDSINSYRRLSYTPWHALAEFVDNSTQAYFNHRELLDAVFAKEGRKLEVNIVYDRDTDTITVSDNSIGMTEHELTEALKVAGHPPHENGRCKYGMGMKTSACWFGDRWRIRTKKLGETQEVTVDIDVQQIASGDADLQPIIVDTGDTSTHYTELELMSLHRKYTGRTIGKIREFLGSMYRSDIRQGVLDLHFQSSPVLWDDLDGAVLRAPDGTKYRKDFHFEVVGLPVYGWVAVLETGSRRLAGFSIMQHDRVIKGFPDSWRPAKLYGQEGGSNDMVNQRLVGEIHLNGFDVTHTKDDILWKGDEEEELERLLLEHCGDYRTVARDRRKGRPGGGPSPVEVNTAVDQVLAELSSDQLVDALELSDIPPSEVVDEAIHEVVEAQEGSSPRMDVLVGSVRVRVFLSENTSPNDPYYAFDFPNANEIMVVINMRHPHVTQVKGTDGFANYLRHCIFDAVAEHKAMLQRGVVHSGTIKMYKDALLRVPLLLEDSEYDAEVEAADED